MRQITLNRQLLGLEDLLFGTGTVTQNRANQVVTITEINAGNLPFDETRTLVEFAQATNLEELGNSVEAINNLNNNLDKLLIVEDNLPIINNVEAIKESIVTLDTNILALQNIDTNMSSINTVEDNLPEVVSVAQNIVPNLTEILNVDTLAAQVTQDKSDVSSMKLVVETIYDTFDDRFLGTKIVDPTLDNDGDALIDGAMYFNTSSNTMKVYDVGTTTWYSIPQIYLSALLDVQLTSITSGNVLRWNGTKWINYTLSKSDVGLNLVNNTADSAKNVLSSTKLTTARTINGVSFDGSANITVSDSTAVKLTGNQTLDDIKTFNSSPIVPTPTANTQAVNKAYVDGKYSGFKNYIINGNFDIWQRGTSHTTNSTINYGSADRWRSVNIEPTNLITTQQEVSGVVPFQAKYFIRQTVPLNTTSGTVLDQFIEGLRQFSNKVITLSMWVKGTTGKKIGIGLEASYGTGGSPSINESILGSVYTLSGGWEKISITRILPDFINGKTYGTNRNDCFRVAILTQAGSIGLTPEIFFQSGTFDIAQVQLEEGSVATPFENRPYGLELSLCQRYYEVGFTKNYVTGTSGASTISTQYKVTKRAAASCTYVAAAFAPTATERLDLSGFTTNRVDGTEQAFFWFASAEL